MQPLKITAHMQDGRVATVEPWLPLDGILAAIWMQLHHPELMETSVVDFNNLIEADLPFERWGTGNGWYWACSFNTVPPLKEYVTHWHKRFDDALDKYIDFGKRRGSVNVKSGKHKAYRMPLVIQLFDRLVWYAVGDLEQVRELCQKVTHIGKKPSQGFGAVADWNVEPWQEDWSVSRDGQVTRAVPVDAGMPPGIKQANVRLYGIRPPYWYRGHQMPCYIPGVVE